MDRLSGNLDFHNLLLDHRSVHRSRPKKPPTKPRTPRPLFSLMFSIESFIPILDVTGVKEWGWDLQPGYRWLAVVERLLGLLILYSAAYSLTYYVL